MSTLHILPTAELAPRVLLPGDPGRALMLAQELLEAPRMFNHNRGLWGYSGSAKLDGGPLTIQSTGMGGPSAAIVLHELIELGATVAIRVGTCGALAPLLRLGDLVLAHEAIAADGVGTMLGKAERLSADADLVRRLETTASPEASGTIVSTDLFYEPASSARETRWAGDGAVAVEMEAAALFAVGAAHGVAVACLLTVSDVLGDAGQRERITDEPLLVASKRMGAAAVAALAS